MFTESLLDSAPLSQARRWPKLLSYTLQTLALGLLILAPLFRTYAVPALVEISQLLAPPSGAPPRPPEPPTTPTNVVHASELSGNAVMMPVRIPQRPAIIHDDQNSPAPLANGVFVADAIPGTEPRNSIVSDLVAHAPVPQPRPAAPSRARLSEGVSQGYLARRVEPAYPPLAIAARVQGAVILLAVISRNGEIENLRVASGHPMLASAALNAVRQWRYQPYRLNGEPVEVETQITVNFVLRPIQ